MHIDVTQASWHR